MLRGPTFSYRKGAVLMNKYKINYHNAVVEKMKMDAEAKQAQSSKKLI